MTPDHSSLVEHVKQLQRGRIWASGVDSRSVWIAWRQSVNCNLKDGGS